jgi:hypothetical protein
MAKLGEPVHPNVVKAAMSERARFLCDTPEACAARREEILSMRRNLMRVIDIAKHFGVTRTRIYQILRKASCDVNIT